MKLALILAGSALFASGINAHGDHHQDQQQVKNQKPPGLSWQNWHMLEEHDLSRYDAEYFFKLHDVQGEGNWGRSDILNLYGLLRDQVVGDGSGMGEHTSHHQEIITQEAKDHVVKTILALLDTNNDGVISFAEYKQFTQNGGELPDFGYGQGHHLDFESEYEEHHWKKYHMANDPDVLIKHKEDIEHELLHHKHEIEESHTLHPEIRKTTNSFFSNIRLDKLSYKYRRE
ncbi:uncharacterized protein RJT20DRAFT_125794 [Scheffersomyces xylosifermentans]|uniref:uncharacterized protein n=1 Tax=Scheffersomyces xylosifermentans TaxID=1304137 RepID=UPI00315D228A